MERLLYVLETYCAYYNERLIIHIDCEKHRKRDARATYTHKTYNTAREKINKLKKKKHAKWFYCVATIKQMPNNRNILFSQLIISFLLALCRSPRFAYTTLLFEHIYNIHTLFTSQYVYYNHQNNSRRRTDRTYKRLSLAVQHKYHMLRPDLHRQWYIT